MDSWLNVVLLCGLLSIASLQTANAFRFRRSESKTTMKETIRYLQDHYKTLGTEWIAKSSFASHLDQLNSKASCTCQRLLLERMLDIYKHIFLDMSNKSEDEKVKEKLNELNEDIEKLRQEYSGEHKVWRELQEINLAKVKNGTTQAGALNDFLMVFKHAKKHQNKVQREDTKVLSSN